MLWQIKAAIVAASFLMGVYVHYRWVAYDQAKAVVAASEARRIEEKQNERRNLVALDRYSVSEATRQQVVVAPRNHTLASVQRDTDSFASRAPANPCESDPRVRILADLLKESNGLLAEGAGHLEAIRAQKQGLIERE